MPLDRVFVRKIRLDASIGVLPWEREMRQPLEVDVDVELDNTLLLRTRDISRGADFEQIIRISREVVSAGHIDFVERVADAIASRILERMPVESVRVQVRKYSACAAAADHVGVEAVRHRAAG